MSPFLLAFDWEFYLFLQNPVWFVYFIKNLNKRWFVVFERAQISMIHFDEIYVWNLFNMRIALAIVGQTRKCSVGQPLWAEQICALRFVYKLSNTNTNASDVIRLIPISECMPYVHSLVLFKQCRQTWMEKLMDIKCTDNTLMQPIC